MWIPDFSVSATLFDPLLRAGDPDIVVADLVLGQQGDPDERHGRYLAD